MSETNLDGAQSEATGPATKGRTAAAGNLGDDAWQAAKGVTGAMQQVADFVGQFSQVARAEACVGPAQTADGHTVIPVASVSLQAGFGLGFGGGSGGEGTAKGQGGGGGGGGGGRSASRVIAIVDVSAQGTKVVPVLDVGSLAISVMALVGLALLVRRGNGGTGRRLLPLLRPGQP